MTALPALMQTARMWQMNDANEELIQYFKLLADASRLKIIGLLARQPYSGQELSALVELKPSTVSHHLGRLVSAGLVSARAEGYYNMYYLEETALQKIRLLFSAQHLEVNLSGLDLDAYDRKVLSVFLRPDGSLKAIPAQRKKLEAVLRHIVRAFKPGRKYSEKQVNQVLARFHSDTASLRRELVASSFMLRQGGGGDYWVNGSTPK
jgi:DNA-binding HxlR family transcriptional regulator